MATVEAGPEARRACLWPATRATDALANLARACGLATNPRGEPASSSATVTAGRLEMLTEALRETAHGLGLEIEEVETSYGEVDHLAQGSGPALLLVPETSDGAGDGGLLALLRRRGRKARLLAPDLSVVLRPVDEVADWLRQRADADAGPRIEGLLQRLEVRPRRAERARRALLNERLRGVRLRGCWLVRLPPGSSFWRQFVDEGLVGQMVTYLITYVVSFALLLLSWWMLGRGALDGNLSHDWLLAWGLILISLILPRQISTWAQARLAVGAGTLLKRRLLQGALKLEPDEIRHQGAGQLLGRVIESEAMQSHALMGGFLTTVGVIELVLSAWVLLQGAAGWLHVMILAVWFCGLLAIGWRYGLLRRNWTDERLRMTHDLVERLIGHRTRLTQERRERWHEEEDQALESYLLASRDMDSFRTFLVVSSFAWTVPGLAGLVPAFVAGGASTGALALGIGGVLLAMRAFNKISRGFTSMMSAWISWRQAAPIYRAAARSSDGAVAGLVAGLARREDDEESTPQAALVPVIEGREIVFNYADRARPILDGCSFEIRRGDRILLEGPSGGGKSTLAGILTRLRPPTSGLLLLGGLDRHTVGSDAWRRHVVSAPQFHENHVLTETFAFNLLMGRRWPPRKKDLAEAEEVCKALGLGELLQRMPSGLMQMVGETGWQLSHGERSRLFMARALLQGTDLVILDESFAALDPENLHRALHCALDRAPTLLVIAHP